MPNYTDNLGLIQPLGSEKIRIAQINQNMDTLDEAVGAVGDKSLQQQILDIGGGIAIMANGNTHPAITAGQFVFVRNHGTLADGAYTANSNIAENANLSSSNLTAVPGGGFNALKAGITSLSENLNSIHHLDRQTDADAVHNNASANTFYRTVMSANSSNMPNTHAFWLEGNKISEAYGIQVAVDTETGYKYIRNRWGMAQWTNWDSLNGKISSSDANGIISNGTNTITVTKTSFVIFVFRGNTGKYYVGFCSDGYFTMPSGMRSDNDVSMSISGTTVTITSNYQYDMRYRIIPA